MKLIILAIILIIASSVSALELPSETLGVGAGGQVHAVCIDPDDPTIFYIGTDVSGVWRSDDAGASWAQWSAGLPNSNETLSCYVDDLKVVVDIVYAATLGGIYKRSKIAGDWVLQTLPDEHSYIFDNAGDVRKYGTAIPFSTIAHDTLTGKLLAGAGTSRSLTRAVFYPNTVCVEYDTDEDFNFVQYESGPSNLYSLWEESGGEWEYDDSSAGMGMVRALDAMDGKVLLTGTNGIYLRDTSDNWARLDTLSILDGGPQTEWGKWCWSARFADANTVYALADAHSDTLVRGVFRLDLSSESQEWEQVGSLGQITKPQGSADYSWEDVLEEGYVNRMNINIGDDKVELYVGERQRYREGGLYYLSIPSGTTTPQTLEWTHMFSQQGNWDNTSNEINYWSTYSSDFVTMSDEQIGWQDNDQLNSISDIAIYNGEDDSIRIIAWQNGNGWLYETDDTSTSLTNIYCTGSSDNWQNIGLNLMVCHDILSLPDGRLYVADDDYGVFLGEPDHDGFKWLDWKQRDYSNVTRDAFRISVVDSELMSVHMVPVDEDTTDSYYMQRANTGKRVLTSYQDTDFPRIMNTALDSIPYHVIDFVSPEPDVLIVTTREVIYGQNYESVIYKLSKDNGEWGIDEQTDHIVTHIMDIEHIPGTSLIALALFGGGQDGESGVKVLDYNDMSVSEWLPGDDSSFLGQCVRQVKCLAVDPAGSVLYVGTEGQSLSNSTSSYPTTGTALRLLAPFSTAKPDDSQWEVLANRETDSFDFSNQQNYYHSGWSLLENAQRMTKITALEIDPNDPTIVYAGMSSSRFHPKNGVWRYEDGTWSHILGQEESFHEQVLALEFDYNDPSILYAGSNGGDLREINVPVSLPILTRFTDRSEEVYQPTQSNNIGVKYTGNPYSEVLFDYNLDGRQDLLVTQIDGQVVLYEHMGNLEDNDPNYIKDMSLIWSTLVGARGIAVADFTNDTEPSRLGRGYPDIFIAHETDAKILKNIDGEYFVDVTDSLGVRELIQNSWCGSWGDYDGDGQVDLFVGKGTGPTMDPFRVDNAIGGMSNVILRNDYQSTGTFIDVSSGILNADSDSLTATVTASWIDVDKDLDLDLFVGDVGNSEPVQNNSSLYINQGDGKFIEDGNFSSTIDIIEQVRGSVWVDYQNDNDWDLVIPSSDNQYFLINDGSGCLGLQLHSNLPGSYSTVLVQDFDLDNQTDYLWLPYSQDQLAALAWGQPGISVMELLDSISWSGIETTGPIFTAALADLTGDGDLDLFIGDVTKEDENSYGKFYYRSGNVFGTDFPVNDWFSVRLIGDGGTNKSAIGAIVEAEINGIDYWQVVDGGSGLGTQRSSLLTFGVPPGHSENLQCTVLWPDGYRQDFTANHSTTTFVYDDSPPELVIGSFSATAYALPNNESDWAFQWDTQYSSDPVLDTVVITEVPGATPNCQIDTIIITPASSNVSSKITRQPDGSYRHIMTLHNTDCASRCSYNAQASSSVYNQDGTLRTTSTATRPFRMAACLGM